MSDKDLVLTFCIGISENKSAGQKFDEGRVFFYEFFYLRFGPALERCLLGFAGEMRRKKVSQEC